MCLILKTTASAVRLSGLVRFTHSADVFFSISSCYLMRIDTKYFVVVVVINFETIIGANILTPIMNEILTRQPFSTNTPLRSGRFCYLLFCADHAEPRDVEHPDLNSCGLINFLIAVSHSLFISYDISFKNAKHYCFATIPIQQTSLKL